MQRSELEVEQAVVAMQLKEQKKVRLAHNKAAEQMRRHHEAEMQRLAQQDAKGRDALLRLGDSEREKLRVRHAAEQGETAKSIRADEKKHAKSLKDYHKTNQLELAATNKKMQAEAKAVLKAELRACPRREAKEKKRAHADHVSHEREHNAAVAQQQAVAHEARATLAVRVMHLKRCQAEQARQLGEEVALLTRLSESLCRHQHERTDARLAAAAAQCGERAASQREYHVRLCAMEDEQMAKCEQAAEKALKKRQQADLRRQPKLLASGRDEIRRSHTETVKASNKQHKALLSEASKMPKSPDKSDTLKRHKAEQAQRLSRLEEQQKQSIADFVRNFQEQVEKTHAGWWDKHRAEFETARASVASYQAARAETFAAKHAEEQRQLEADRAAAQVELRGFEADEDTRLEEQRQRQVQLAGRHEEQLHELTISHVTRTRRISI